MDLNNRIDIGKSATRMTVTLHRLKSEEMRKLEVRGQEWLRANAPDLVSLVPNLIPAAWPSASGAMCTARWGTADLS